MARDRVRRGDGRSPALGEDPAVVVDVYRGEAGAFGFAAGRFGLVLLGRILFIAVLQTSLRDAGRDSLVVDFPVDAIIVRVAIEVASFGPLRPPQRSGQPTAAPSK